MDFQPAISDFRSHESHGRKPVRLPSRIASFEQKTHGLTPVALRHSSFVTRHSSFATRGFSFTELLFAVMILGIGFILVAAIFPVGLSQTKSNFDETQTASLARAAAAEMGRVGDRNDYDDQVDAVAPTGPDNDGTAQNIMYPMQGSFSFNLTAEAERAMVSPADGRYAWVGFWRRPNGSASVQLSLVLVNRSQPFSSGAFWTDGLSYGQGDKVVAGSMEYICLQNHTASSSNSPLIAGGVNYWRSSLAPRRVRITANTQQIVVHNTGQTGLAASNFEAAAPGSFVIVSDDQLGAPYDVGHYAGRAYRLGSLISSDTDSKTFEYFPGSAFEIENFDPDDSGPTSPWGGTGLDDAWGYVVGRNRVAYGSASDFEGTSMDVAYYTTFISLK